MKQGYYTEKELQDIFISNLSEDMFEIIDVRHIVHITYKGEDYYVMLRSVSYAGNPHPRHRFRSQLSRRPYLDYYKTNGGIFLFVGYDAIHDVYVLWNPFTLRPRLNEKESVSLFCELSTLEHAQLDGLVWNKLPNGGLYVTFTSSNLTSVLDELSYFKTEVTIPVKKEMIIVNHRIERYINSLAAQNHSRLEILELCIETFGVTHPDWSFLEWRQCITKIIETTSE